MNASERSPQSTFPGTSHLQSLFRRWVSELAYYQQLKIVFTEKGTLQEVRSQLLEAGDTLRVASRGLDRDGGPRIGLVRKLQLLGAMLKAHRGSRMAK